VRTFAGHSSEISATQFNFTGDTILSGEGYGGRRGIDVAAERAFVRDHVCVQAALTRR